MWWLWGKSDTLCERWHYVMLLWQNVVIVGRQILCVSGDMLCCCGRMWWLWEVRYFVWMVTCYVAVAERDFVGSLRCQHHLVFLWQGVKWMTLSKSLWHHGMQETLSGGVGDIRLNGSLHYVWRLGDMRLNGSLSCVKAWWHQVKWLWAVWRLDDIRMNGSLSCVKAWWHQVKWLFELCEGLVTSG